MFPCEMARYIAGFPQKQGNTGRVSNPQAADPSGAAIHYARWPSRSRQESRTTSLSDAAGPHRLGGGIASIQHFGSFAGHFLAGAGARRRRRPRRRRRRTDADLRRWPTGGGGGAGRGGGGAGLATIGADAAAEAEAVARPRRGAALRIGGLGGAGGTGLWSSQSRLGRRRWRRALGFRSDSGTDRFASGIGRGTAGLGCP